MKILHLADLHLDTPFIGLGQEFSNLRDNFIQAPYQALSKGISLAIDEAVDIVLIAGDVYDSDRQTVYAQHYLMSQIERLNQADIPVVMLHGNHDYIKKDKAVPRYPKNTHLFKNEEIEHFDIELKNGENVRVYGFSYEDKWIEEAKINEFPLNPHETDYTLGMIHGQISQGEAKNQYAPFTLQDLLSKQYDYWALGHVHQSQVLNEEPLVIYSGTIQGSHRNEAGDKGCYIIELEKNRLSSYKFYSLAPIRWVNTELEMDEELQASDLLDKINNLAESYLEEAKSSNQSIILSIELSQAQLIDDELYQQISSGEILENINQLTEEDNFVIVRDLRPKASYKINKIESQEKLQAGYNQAVKNLLKGDLYETVMDELFSHTIVQSWLKDLRTDERLKETIIENTLDKIAQTTSLVSQEVVDNED